jgi:NADH-quinone oxidoreductase subunit F
MDQGPLVLLKNINQPNQDTLAGYESRGGYQAFKKALTKDGNWIIDEVTKSGLRGRGGAGFPTGKKWSFCPRNSGKPIYIVNNADESEPGTFKDRVLMERDPHLTIEGMMIAAFAMNSPFSCIYIRGEYAYAAEKLSIAIEELYKKGYLGKNILGTNFSHDMAVHRGAGAYICGEETGLLESLEGRKGQPRLKPPFFPAARGLYDAPTVLNNVETFAVVPYIIQNGAEAYAKLGTEKSKGTKLFSVSGHVNRPGVYEKEFGYPLKKLIFEDCGGIVNGNRLKAVIPGGSSVPVLRGEEIENLLLSYEGMEAAGSYIGSGGVIVMDHTTDMCEAISNLLHFYAHESCGQCTPCREGGHWIEKVFHRISHGKGLPGDIELIDNLANNIKGRTICFFGDSLAMPAQSFLAKFGDEFRARIPTA